VLSSAARGSRVCVELGLVAAGAAQPSRAVIIQTAASNAIAGPPRFRVPPADVERRHCSCVLRSLRLAAQPPSLGPAESCPNGGVSGRGCEDASGWPGALSSRFGGVSCSGGIHCLAAGPGRRFGASRVRWGAGSVRINATSPSRWTSTSSPRSCAPSRNSGCRS